MSSRWIFPAALIASLLIHLCIILFLQKKPEIPEKKDDPIEVSYVPKEEKKQEPIQEQKPQPEPLPRTPQPVIEPKDTTLDHDLPGGESKGIKKPEKAIPAPTPKPSIPSKAGDIVKPPELPEQEMTTAEEPKDTTDLSKIWDTEDIVAMIANRKPEQPKGQDTASYNAFQEKYFSYFEKFRNRIYQQWKYPQNAAMRGESGVVSVTFSILKDGSVVNIKMTKSSGYPELDREVMRVLKNIGKIPLPSSYNLDQLNVDEANFIYVIGRGVQRFIE